MSGIEPDAAGARVAALIARSGPSLFQDLADAGAVPDEAAARERARTEWECFALFGCVRGIVAASGFAPRTVETIDALHGAVFAAWESAPRAGDGPVALRALLSRRYSEYETIAQTGGASGAHDVATRLGAAAAQHLFGEAPPPADVAVLLGSMHEALAEAVVSLLSGESALSEDDDAPPRERPAADAGARAAEPPLATALDDGVPDGVATPPLGGAWRIVARLERAGIECALGGSGLLAALGLADTVRDWDLTTDAPRRALEAALAGLEWENAGSDELHADEKLMFPGLELEIIRGFAFFTPAGVVRVPTIVTRRWAGLPVGSPECWVAAYHLLGRERKRDDLLDWLGRNGASRAALDALLAQPLPDALATALRALPPAAA